MVQLNPRDANSAQWRPVGKKSGVTPTIPQRNDAVEHQLREELEKLKVTP